MRLGIRDHLRATGEFFAETLLPPRRDNLEFRRERRGGQLEAHLVVAFARGAMRHGLRTFRRGDLHHALGDERTGDARAEKILSLVERAGAEHGENEITRELLLQIVDEAL